MNVKLFGPRCLVEHYTPKTNGATSIVIPDTAKDTTHGTHRYGKVVAVGEHDRSGNAITSLVKVGDVVLFQINQVMEHTQTYVRDGKAYMNMLQTEAIARLRNGDSLTVDNMELLGDYVLLRHFVRDQGSKLVLPENLTRQTATEYIYFKIMAKGRGVDLPIKEGDEVICNYGRLTPIFFLEKNGSSVATTEYCYTTSAWIDAVVTR